jgi:uncharacterized protein YdeI (YjbR/CyaY-like superfamily)
MGRGIVVLMATQTRSTPSRDPRIDAYIAKSAAFAQPILTHLRDVIHAACPQVQETIKWGMPSFEYKGFLCGMAAFKKHATFGFWKHDLVVAAVVDKPGVIDKVSREAMGSFGKLASVDDLPSKRALTAMIRIAMKLNEDGVKAPRAAKSKKPPPKMPADLAAALKKSAAARKHFEAFSPSKQRDYIEWLEEAKTEATRSRRLATALEWIAEGKSRNWKYERC